MRSPLLLTLLVLIPASATRAAEPKYKLGDIPSAEEKAKRDKQQIGENDVAVSNDAELANQIAEEFYQKGLKALNEGNLDQAEGYFDRVLILKPKHKGAQEGIDTIMKAHDRPNASADITGNRLQLVKKLELILNQKFNAGDWEGADEVAEEILAVDPTNKGAKQKQSLLHRQFFDRAVVRADERESAGDLQGALDSLRVALSYRKDPSLRIRARELQEKLAKENAAKSDQLYIQALAASQNGDNDKAVGLCKLSLGLNPANQQAQRMLERLSPKIPAVIK